MLGATLKARPFLERVGQELLRVDVKQIQALADAIHESYKNHRFVSFSKSSRRRVLLPRSSQKWEAFEPQPPLPQMNSKKRLKVLSLTDNTPYILAWANDEGYDRVFVEQLKNLADPGDLLVAISGSGNSPNILKAVEWSNRRGLRTFGCTGFSGGKLKTLAQQNLHVPLDDMGIVESIHLTIFHWVLDHLYSKISS